MKKSNKILLGGFLTIVLVLVAIDVALYARFKAGNYTAINEEMAAKESSNGKVFANAHHIDIRHFKNVTLFVGEQLKVEPFGYDKDEIVLTEKNGVVHLALKDSLRKDNSEMYGPVSVYVPDNSLVTSKNATVIILGQEGKKTQNLNFMASGGYLIFKQYRNTIAIDSLNVEAFNSAVVELQNVQIEKLSVHLNASELIDQKAIIHQLKLNADSASRINLQSKNLINLTTKTAAHE